MDNDKAVVINNGRISAFEIEIDRENATITGRISLYMGKGNDQHTSYTSESGKEVLDWILKCLDTLGVNSTEDLVGLPVRVMSSGTRITKLGHFVDDEWCDVPVSTVGMTKKL